MSFLLEIAWTHVSSRIRQTFIGVLGVATGVGFTIMLAGLMQGGQKDFIHMLVDTMPHVTVTDERISTANQPAEQVYGASHVVNLVGAERRSGITNPSQVISSIRPWLPGSIAPSIKISAMINIAQKRIGVKLTGIDPRQEEHVSKLVDKMREGQLGDLNRASNAVIIGGALAKELGARVGSNVTISTGQGISISGPVVGIFQFGVRDIDEGQIYALIRTAQVLVAEPTLINEMRVRLNDALAAHDVASQIEGQTGYRSISWQEANADLLSAFKIRDLIMMLVMAAMMLASTFAIYSIISTITNEKRHDIAIMKSLGIKERRVQLIFIVESVIIGTVGVIAGSALGYFLCVAMGQITFTNPFTGSKEPIPIYFTPTNYVVVAVLSLVCCAAAALFPSWKATRVHPVDIIRGAS
jgi:lipoprotein-releasing system permease protein